MLGQDFEKERMAVCLYFDRCMESENLPYESEERRAFMEEGRQRVERLIEKVGEVYESKGKFLVQQDLSTKLKSILDGLQDPVAIGRLNFLDEMGLGEH